MKKMMLSMTAVAAMATFAYAGGDIDPVEPVVGTPVVAESTAGGAYLGLGFTAEATGSDTLNIFSAEDGQDRTGELLFLAGYEINPYIAVEARYGTSVMKGDILETDTWGIYVKPQYPVNEKMNVYALIGYGGLQADGVDGANVSVDDNGFQWGLGFSYDVAENVAIFADYVSIANDMTADAYPNFAQEVSSDAYTVGVIYKF